MSNLVLEIRICPKSDQICVNEPGKAPASKHRANRTHKVTWKRGGNQPIESWKVWLKDSNGQPLPPDQSPFENERVEFSASGGKVDQEDIRGAATLGKEYEYGISCVLDDGSTVEVDPILVISDADRDLETAVKEIVSKVDELTGEVQALSGIVDRLAQEVARLADGLSA